MTKQRKQQQCTNHAVITSKRVIEVRWIIASVILLLIGVGTLLWILSSGASWTTIMPVAFLTILGLIIGLFQWLFPLSSDDPKTTMRVNATYSSTQLPRANSSDISEKIQEQATLLHASSSLPKFAYRGIAGVLPPTDPRTIQQRHKIVQEIYSQLTHRDTTAVVLTGMGGSGKSTIAALAYRYAEEQRQAGHGSFKAPAIWLHIDSASTMTDLAGNLFEALDRPMPDFNNLSLQHQAQTLFNTLNMTNKPRLVILDQFENLLDWQTGYALPSRPGVDEWLDAMNGQPCQSRLLLTSRPWPQSTRRYPPTYTQEYHVSGLETIEGIELLRKSGITAQEKELSKAVNYCAGHAFALTLLSTLLRSRHLSLSTFFQDAVYTQIWTGNVSRNLLDSIYEEQLNERQRLLLASFSIYREPVSHQAALTILDENDSISEASLHKDLDALFIQHLLQPVHEGKYQLHAIVANYAQNYLKKLHTQNNLEIVHTFHAKAARYYLSRIAKFASPNQTEVQQTSTIPLLVEAIWHWCRAGEWQMAYELMEEKALFFHLKSRGDNATLLELYHLLLPIENWPASASQEAHIYDNLGIVYRILRRANQALEYLEHALRTYQKVQDRRGESTVLNNIGRLHADTGQRELAIKEYQQALHISLEEQDYEGEGTALNHIGWIYVTENNNEQALASYERALDIFKEQGNLSEAARTLNNLGRIHEDKEQYEQAQKYYEQALDLARKAEDSKVEGWTLNNLGKVYGKLGQNKVALDYLKQALSLRHRIDRRGEGRTINNIGEVYIKQNQIQKAWNCYRDAFKIAREMGDYEGEGKVLYNVGHYYLQQKRYDLSLASFLFAREAFSHVQSPYVSQIEQQILHLIKKYTLPDLSTYAKVEACQYIEQALQSF